MDGDFNRCRLIDNPLLVDAHAGAGAGIGPEVRPGQFEITHIEFSGPYDVVGEVVGIARSPAYIDRSSIIVGMVPGLDTTDSVRCGIGIEQVTEWGGGDNIDVTLVLVQPVITGDYSNPVWLAIGQWNAIVETDNGAVDRAVRDDLDGHEIIDIFWYAIIVDGIIAVHLEHVNRVECTILGY